MHLMRVPVIMGSVPPSTSPGDNGDDQRAMPLLWGPGWREHLLRTSKRRPLVVLPAGGSVVKDTRRGTQLQPHGSLLHAARSPFMGHALRQSKIGRSKAMTSGLFRRYEPFPVVRYRVIQPLQDGSTTTKTCPYAHRSSSGSKKTSKASSYVAYDALEKRHVLITAVPKVAASVWQIDHVHRVMLTLARGNGFQRLLEIWEHDDDAEGTPSWVFVQDFELTWIPLDLYCEGHDFSEDKLRHMVFDVVSMVHFLHTHDLSACGQLCGNQDLMINVDTQRVVWIVSPSLVLSGCLLALSTPGRCSRDITAIGYLMFHLSVVGDDAALLASSTDIDALQDLIREHLLHLSRPCREMMLWCLTEHPTIEELIKRKWLRHVDFVSIVPKLEHYTLAPQHQNSLVIRSLLMKLAAFFVENMHNLGAFPSAAATAASSSSPEEEEVESPRRLTRRTPSKRSYVEKRVYMGPHHFHHGSGGGTGGTSLLKRGMVIVPPLSSAIIPHEGRGDSYKEDFNRFRSRSFIFNEVELLPKNDDIIYEVSARAISNHTNPYDSFGYEFPASPSTIPSTHEYEEFDLEDDVFLVEASALEGDIIEDGEGRRERTGSVLLHENSHNHSLHSISSLRNVVRSLHPSIQHSWSSGSTSGLDPKDHIDSVIHARSFSKDDLDPVHLSAFGPSDISLREEFRLDIWAYLRQQRKEMLETALELNESEVAQRVQPLHIARGTLITVSIEPSDQFGVIGDECKSFRWRGEVNGVSFDMYRKASKTKKSDDEVNDDDSLCIARIVAGTKVSLMFIRLKSSVQGDLNGAPTAPLSTRLEHLTASVPDIAPKELEMLRPIGKGAFGEAMLAIWKKKNVKVVIKSPHFDAHQGDSEVLEAFRHEVAVMQLLGKHPHVVELLATTSATATADDHSAIVTEYLPNGSLHDFLMTSEASQTPAPLDQMSSSSPLSLFSRTMMARDAAHGIVNIHQGHVLHRDIAARNCLLDSHFRVKVCDFGLSRLSSKSRLFFDDEHHGFGPIKWMAPESVLPPHLFSTHSDSYMFGVLMYEIFSGQLPFPGVSSREAMALILEGEHVPIPEYLPHTHKQLMKSCFDPHPLARPTMDQIFLKLDEWILHDTRYHTRVPVGIL